MSKSSVLFTLRIDPNLKQILYGIRDREGIPLTFQVEAALKLWLKEKKGITFK